MAQEQERLRVVVSTPLDEELCTLIERAEPRIDLIRDQSLLPPMRWPGDHGGDPAWQRTPEQQAAFDALVDSAEALYGVPDEKPAALARTVAANARLRWVQTMPAGGGSQVAAAGLDRAALDSIAFTTSAGVHGDNLAEFAVFGVMAGAKSLPRLLEQQRSRTWSGRWCMQQVSEMRIGVLGLGGIGRSCAEKFIALGAEVIGINRRDVDLPGLARRVHPDELATLVAELDALVVTLPGTELTLGMVSREVLAAVKPGLILVSVGRGTVIDEPAMIEALQDGRIGFAALDVFAQEPLATDSPLWGLPNVLVSPHTAALNAAEDRRIAELFARNATLFLDGEPQINRVDTVEFY
ncbi:MAG: D-2-hydroxyacid dehydrogenase [Micropruina sp.]|nr:MAG: D-2-hydroxyacid dehydrogenase [Micropruina sp.]